MSVAVPKKLRANVPGSLAAADITIHMDGKGMVQPLGRTQTGSGSDIDAPE